ncbi:DNA-directed RNA polymerase subunit alpha [Candidatus Dojkabacteria bacterium]|nr:DNA-directed RNA polymerase subunit alpha [Candidatus Dojkabacteria bacterium]
MFALDKIKITTVEDSDTRGRFLIGPLPQGYGHTVGNSLRRILLTSISGAAITSVKIKGITHEYSTMEGLDRDILKFVLGLKNVALKSHSEEPVVLKLNVKAKSGENLVVKASDFEENPDIEIANPDLELAVLTKPNSSLDVEVTIEKGLGYSYADETKRSESNVIPIDVIFSPVKHVKMQINATRVGQQTNLDEVELIITTNGAVKPSETLFGSFEIYDLIANRLVNSFGGDSENNSLDTQVDEEVIEEPKKISVSQQGLSTRLMNSLLNSGISDLNLLQGRGKNEVLNFKGMGKKSYDELMEILEKFDIKLED